MKKVGYGPSTTEAPFAWREGRGADLRCAVKQRQHAEAHIGPDTFRRQPTTKLAFVGSYFTRTKSNVAALFWVEI